MLGFSKLICLLFHCPPLIGFGVTVEVSTLWSFSLESIITLYVFSVILVFLVSVPYLSPMHMLKYVFNLLALYKKYLNGIVKYTFTMPSTCFNELKKNKTYNLNSDCT